MFEDKRELIFIWPESTYNPTTAPGIDMGIPSQRFVQEVSENLLCSICGCVLEDAVLTPCGHSFCSACLNTWLTAQQNRSCPACRGPLYRGEPRPILSVRNLIGSMSVHCENNGCPDVLKLEDVVDHQTNCRFGSAECESCGMALTRGVLVEHQLSCPSIGLMSVAHEQIQEVISTNNSVVPRSARTRSLTGILTGIRSNFHHDPYVSLLGFRISSMEIQIRKMRRDLDIAESKNKKLEQELRKTREDLHDKHSKILEHQRYVEFDPEYEYGYTPQSITKLASLISRFLIKKPSYIDSVRTFHGIKKCYENFAWEEDSESSRKGSSRKSLWKHDYTKEVQMLLATARASGWFTASQQVHIVRWLKRTVARTTESDQGT